MSQSVSRDYICGLGAGMAGIFVGHPLDTVKVHQQVSGTKPMVTISFVLKNYGILGFYRGLLAPMCSQGTVISLLFGTSTTALGYIVDKERLRQQDPTASVKSIQEVSTIPESFAAGMVGGFTVSFLQSPIELVKVQMQIDGGRTIKNPVKCVQKIVALKGVNGLFIGLPATLSRNVHAFACYLTTYKIFSDWAKRDAREKGKSAPESIHLFMAGGISGLMYWLVNMPMDRVKSQIQGTSLNEAKVPGIIQSAKKIYAADGLKGFYKGVSVVVIRAPPVSGVIFLSLEYFRAAWDYVALRLL